MFTVRCDSCGFKFYASRRPKTIKNVINAWGGTCPKCMSPLSPKPIKIFLKIENGKRQEVWGEFLV